MWLYQVAAARLYLGTKRLCYGVAARTLAAVGCIVYYSKQAGAKKEPFLRMIQGAFPQHRMLSWTTTETILIVAPLIAHIIEKGSPMYHPHRTDPGRPPYRVAVTGHIVLGDAAAISFVAQAFLSLLSQLKEAHPEGLVALFGLAPGADALFAEAALRLELPLEACLANSAVGQKLEAGPMRDQHYQLRARSRVVHELPFTERSAASYLALGQWLVESCDLLLAAWNGAPPAKPGGTGDVVAIAQRCGRPIIHIHPLQRTIVTLSALAAGEAAAPQG
jgi:hypothetical protein